MTISSVQSLSRVRLSATPWTAAHQASLSITNLWSPPKPMPSSRWCHPTISSSVVPFSSCTQSFPASGSLKMSQFFTSGSQSIGVSASTSVLPMNSQDWSPLGWTGWIPLQSKGLSRVFSDTTVTGECFTQGCSAFQGLSEIKLMWQYKGLVLCLNLKPPWRVIPVAELHVRLAGILVAQHYSSPSV